MSEILFRLNINIIFTEADKCCVALKELKYHYSVCTKCCA